MRILTLQHFDELLNDFAEAIPGLDREYFATVYEALNVADNFSFDCLLLPYKKAYVKIIEQIYSSGRIIPAVLLAHDNLLKEELPESISSHAVLKPLNIAPGHFCQTVVNLKDSIQVKESGLRLIDPERKNQLYQLFLEVLSYKSADFMFSSVAKLFEEYFAFKSSLIWIERDESLYEIVYSFGHQSLFPGAPISQKQTFSSKSINGIIKEIKSFLDWDDDALTISISHLRLDERKKMIFFMIGPRCQKEIHDSSRDIIQQMGKQSLFHIHRLLEQAANKPKVDQALDQSNFADMSELNRNKLSVLERSKLNGIRNVRHILVGTEVDFLVGVQAMLCSFGYNFEKFTDLPQAEKSVSEIVESGEKLIVYVDAEVGEEEFVEFRKKFASSFPKLQIISSARHQNQLKQIVSRGEDALPCQVISTTDMHNILPITVAKIINEDYQGLEKFFPWGTPQQRFIVNESDKIGFLISKIDHFLKKLNVDHRMIEKCQLMFEELFINSMFHAPHDEKGEPLFETLARDQKVTLPEGRNVKVTIASDGINLGLSVKDDYGTLPYKKLLERFDYCINMAERGQWAGRVDGHSQGLGYHLILNFCHHLQIAIDPSNYAETICLIKGFNCKYKDYKARSKSFNMFVKGS